MQSVAHQISVTVPVLETERLILRAPREADFDAMLAFNSGPRSVFIGGGLTVEGLFEGYPERVILNKSGKAKRIGTNPFNGRIYSMPATWGGNK